MFHKKNLCTVKKRGIRVVFIDVYPIDCTMHDNKAIIAAYIDTCCGYRVIIGGILLRLQSNNYGGLNDNRYDYKITLDINFEITRLYKVMFIVS